MKQSFLLQCFYCVKEFFVAKLFVAMYLLCERTKCIYCMKELFNTLIQILLCFCASLLQVVSTIWNVKRNYSFNL